MVSLTSHCCTNDNCFLFPASFDLYLGRRYYLTDVILTGKVLVYTRSFFLGGALFIIYDVRLWSVHVNGAF